MKFIRYSHNCRTGWAVLDGETVRPLGKAPWLGLSPLQETLLLRDVRLLAPAAPSKIVAVGCNYPDHALELGLDAPPEPVLFFKPITALNDPDGAIICPKLSQQVDFEAELAFVVGRIARHVKAEEADGYIFGYTCFNDVTARDIQKKDVQWTRAKGFDGFAPVGPQLVTDIDVSDLAITTRVDGEIRQSSRTSQMIWSIPALFAFITSCMTLSPGDLVATGTPSRAGPLQPGETVEVEIERIGVLRNYAVEENR